MEMPDQVRHDAMVNLGLENVIADSNLQSPSFDKEHPNNTEDPGTSPG